MYWKKKYNIKVVDTNKGAYLDITYHEVFKMISMKSNWVVEKDNILRLEFIGDYKEYLENGSDIILNESWLLSRRKWESPSYYVPSEKTSQIFEAKVKVL